MKDVYKLHVVQRGTGRPVILLHGALSTHRYWDGVAELLQDSRQLIMPDLLGFGGSPKPRSSSYSPEAFIDSLEHTFKDFHFAEKPVLAGHSYGANLALIWALKRPKYFSGVVLSAPLFFEPDLFDQQLSTIVLEGKWLSSKALARVVAFSMGLAGLAPTWLAVRLAPDRPRAVIEDVTSQKFYVFRKMLRYRYDRDAMLGDLPKVQMPTRMLLGDRDMIANRVIQDLEKLCVQNKMCQLQVLPGSHQILLEHPEIVAKTILTV